MATLIDAMNEGVEELDKWRQKAGVTIATLRRVIDMLPADSDAEVSWTNINSSSAVVYNLDNDKAVAAVAELSMVLDAKFVKGFSEYDGQVKFEAEVDGIKWTVWAKPGPSCKVVKLVKGERVIEDFAYNIICE